MNPENTETMATPAEAGVGRSAIVKALLLFCGGFILSAAALHVLIGNPLSLYAAARSEKLEILKRDGYRYNSAMFGSSHVHQGFDPREFDADLAGTPLATTSFNLGIDGGAQIEQREMALGFLNHLQPADTTRPCFVLLEQTATPAFSLMFTSHPRQVNILDLHSLRVILQFPAEGYLRPNQIHRRLVTFTEAFYHAINLGMLSNRIFRPPYDEASIRGETMNDQRGVHYVPTNALEQADLAHAFALRLPSPIPVPARLVEGNTTIMEDLHRARNGDRAQLAWVVMPRLNDLIRYRVYPPSESTSFGDVPIINLGRPDLYPELYDRALWVDSQHVNEAGSKILSRVLAQQLLAWSKDHPVRSCGG